MGEQRLAGTKDGCKRETKKKHVDLMVAYQGRK